MAGVDLSIFGKQKSIIDQQQLQQAFELKKQLAQAELMTAQQKQSYLDVDKLGEQAIFKALQGGQLTPQEEAAAKYAGAKGGGVAFDPTTGSMYQKPNLLGQLGLNIGGQAPQVAPQAGGFAPPPNQPLPEAAPPFELDPNNEYDMQFKQVYEGLANNPKAQQQVLVDYSKDRSNMNEGQAKAGGFADRVAADLPVIADPKVTEALSSRVQRGLSKVPIFGNNLVSNNYQAGEQAQRNTINAILRRESGAVISDSEFDNARKQYFPQPGDSPNTIAQKEANLQSALKGLQRSAGPAYRPPTQPKKSTGGSNIVDYNDL